MTAKKNLYPKIEALVKISQVVIGDNFSLKFKGLHFTPAQAKQLTSWHEGEIEVKLTLQQNEGELFPNGDDPELVEQMTPKSQKDKDDKKK